MSAPPSSPPSSPPRPGLVQSFFDGLLCSCSPNTNRAAAQIDYEQEELYREAAKKTVLKQYAAGPYASTPILFHQYRQEEEPEVIKPARRVKKRKGHLRRFRRSSFQGAIDDLRVTHPLSPVPSCDGTESTASTELLALDSYDSSIGVFSRGVSFPSLADSVTPMNDESTGGRTGIFSRGNSLLSESEEQDTGNSAPLLQKGTPILSEEDDDTLAPPIDNTVNGSSDVIEPCLQAMKENMATVDKWSPPSVVEVKSKSQHQQLSTVSLKEVNLAAVVGRAA